MNTSTEGRRYLGGVIGTTKYRQNYLNEKIEKRIGESRVFCKITWYEQQAAYLCFITGFNHKPTNFMRTIPNISNHPEERDETIRTEFIPAISVGINCSDIEKKTAFFPAKLGGLGIPISSEIADRADKLSRMISKDFTTNVMN